MVFKISKSWGGPRLKWLVSLNPILYENNIFKGSIEDKVRPPFLPVQRTISQHERRGTHPLHERRKDEYSGRVSPYIPPFIDWN